MAVRTERMKEILDIRFENPEKEKELCMQMLSECEDKYTEAFARTYLGDAYHTFGQVEYALPEYSRALKLSEENGYDDLLSVLYNSIGVIYMYNDDEQSALDYFFDGIRLAEKLDDNMMHATLLSNIAYVYRGTGAFDKAEEMIDQVSVQLGKAKHNDANVEIDELGYELDKIWMMLQQHETEEAYKRMQTDEIKQDTSRENYINFAIYYQQTDKPEMCSRYIDLAIDEILNENNKFERILYYFELIEIAIDAGLYDKADEISVISEKLMNKIGTVGKWTKLMEYRIEIYEALGKLEALTEAYAKYYDYACKYEEEKQHAVVTRVRRKIELLHELDRKKEIKQRKADLSDKRGMDELTGLCNRWGINSRIESFFKKYAGMDISMAVAIVDVDFFKEFNDTYGHIAGDRCLREVADILKANAGDNSILGRYGGDEFLITLWGRNKSEVEQIFDSIKADLAGKNIANVKSKVADIVTVTAGIVVTKLADGMDFTGLIHEADKMLYQVKESSRNGYIIKNLG